MTTCAGSGGADWMGAADDVGAGVTTTGRAGDDSLGRGRGAAVSAAVGVGIAGVRFAVSSGAGVGDFFFLAGGCLAGLGLGRGVAEGVAVGTVRICSRALRKSFRFCSSVSWAGVLVLRRPP